MDSIVMGAGMVGVATALALQERGRKVLLVDRREPGRETSYGNAGVIQTEAVHPYAVPLSPRRLGRIALRRAHDVVWSPAGMLDWLGPVARYFWHSLPPNYARIVPHYARLILRAGDDHAPLIAASGSEPIIRQNGFVQAYRSEAAFETARLEAERTHAAFAVPFAALDANSLLAREPHMLVRMHGAIHYTGSWSCRSPGDLVGNYARLFASRGGEIIMSEIQNLRPQGGGWSVRTDAGLLSAPEVVVALGPWSPQLLAPLGYRIPMVLKRGYHQHFKSSRLPSQPLMDVENSTVLSPMENGLRVLTGAELNTLHGAPHRRQIQHAAAIARSLYPIEEPIESTPWHGTRPCMPDMLPVIGPAARHKGLWFNFGHGHQGFTLGPTTATLLADAMTGAQDPETLRPYRRLNL